MSAIPAPLPGHDTTPETLLPAVDRLNALASAINAGQAAVDEIMALVASGITTLIPGCAAAICLYGDVLGGLDGARQAVAFPAGTDGEASDLCPEGLAERVLAGGRWCLSYEGPAATGGVNPVAAFPLRASGRTAGVLYAGLLSARAFSTLELLLLENVANQAATAMDRALQVAEAQRDLARKADELDRLRYAGLLISSRLRLEETLEAILQMALEVTGAHYGVFRLVDWKGHLLVARAIAGERLGRPATEPLPINATSIMGWVAKHRQPLRISDLRTEPWSRVYYPLDHEQEMRSELAVPLIGTGNRLEGVLNLESPVAGAFSEADSHLLQALATQAVIAIQQARLLDAVQEMVERLLTQPAARVRERLVELATELLGEGARAAFVPAEGGPVLATEAATTEWDQKVLAILNHYAALAQQNAERKEALRAAQEQRAVAETFAALGDISANLLHHLNNKVGTIPVRIEGIQDKCAPALAANPYLAANLEEIERSAAEAMQAVRETLSLLHPIHSEPLQLAQCVAAALEAARLPAAIEVQTAGLDRLPPVLAGRHSLTLVIVNLLANAAEAMGSHGVIIIRGETQPGGGEVVLSVADAGPGIAPELHERIFELHFSARGPGSGHKLGFGLWWVKTLLARLGGSISVESDGAHGATFKVRLPKA